VCLHALFLHWLHERLLISIILRDQRALVFSIAFATHNLEM
jgi:hypothetical protein